MQPRDVLRTLFGDEPFFGGRTRGQQSPVAANLLLTAMAYLVATPDRPVRALEIGSWIGFSTLSLAHAIACWSPRGGEIVCVDPWTSYFSDEDKKGAWVSDMDSLAASGLAYDLFCHNVASAPKNVTIRAERGTSTDVCPRLPAGSFDLVYLDGSHYYDAVKADLPAAERLVRDGGILCGDDLEVQLDEIDEATLRASLHKDYVVDLEKQRGYHPGVTLAVWERYGRVSSAGQTWFLRRSQDRFVPIEERAWRMMIPSHFAPAMVTEAKRILGLE